MNPQFVLSLLIAYLLGSIPFASLFARYVRGVDIQTVGDGNPGGKNVFLHISPWAGAVVTLLDVGKGMTALLLASMQGMSGCALLGIGLAAIVGHDWSLFLHFHGGQGMATTIGVFLYFFPGETLMALSIVALVLWLTRHWDLACGMGLVALPILAWWNAHSPELIAYVIALLPLIGVRKWMQRGGSLDALVVRLHRSR